MSIWKTDTFFLLEIFTWAASPKVELLITQYYHIYCFHFQFFLGRFYKFVKSYLYFFLYCPEYLVFIILFIFVYVTYKKDNLLWSFMYLYVAMIELIDLLFILSCMQMVCSSSLANYSVEKKY